MVAETVATTLAACAGPSQSGYFQSYVDSFLCLELAAATGVGNPMTVLAAVAGLTTVANTATNRVGAAPNIGAGTQVSLASILRKASAKEDLVKEMKGKQSK